MKTSRSLPETDLARTALLPDDQKRILLRGVKSFVPPHSFAPVRKVAGALYEARPSLLVDLPARTWPDIEVAIRKQCKNNPHWVEPNLTVAEKLFDFNRERGFKAVEWDFPFIPVGFGAKIKFWHDFYSIQNDRPVLAFIDPRLTDGLTALGRLFMFSAMHHTVAVGDFEGARLEILRFPRNQYSGEREVEVFSFDERDVVEEAVLNEAIDRTYKIWREIVAERTEEARRQPPTGTGGGGFL
jgi:hypothetical protein